VRFLVDAQLPPALAGWLREAGHEAAHVEDFALREAPDEIIWERALETNSIIVTKDEDFPARASQFISAPAPIVVWLRIGNATNVILLAWFEARLPSILQMIAAGDKLIQVI
jgi:predicted nuclease of predicted toxin-antitoxin system